MKTKVRETGRIIGEKYDAESERFGSVAGRQTYSKWGKRKSPGMEV